MKKVLEIKESDQPVVRRIKTSLLDGSVWIRTDVLGNRYIGSFSKRKLADCRFYSEIVCKKRIGETKRNFTGKFYEFEILR